MNVTGSILLACLLLMVVIANNTKPRVLSGKLSVDYDYPFEAIVIIEGKYACTATLITKIQFLTVANCVAQLIQRHDFLQTIKVRIGSILKTHGRNYHAKRISHHIGFSSPYPNFYIHDIAVIHILHPISTFDEVKPIGLPFPNSEVSPKVLVIFSTFAGQKRTNDTVAPLLIRILTNTKTFAKCQNSFESYILTENQVCIEVNSGFRYGSVDMGGPMLDIAQTTILGLASSGFNSNGFKGIPKIFTKVSEYLPYILEEINYGSPNYTIINLHPALNFLN